MKTIYAYTEATPKDGYYPGYVNISTNGKGGYTIIVRSTNQQSGQALDVPAEIMNEMITALNKRNKGTDESQRN